jgi:hypothetical protein
MQDGAWEGAVEDEDEDYPSMTLNADVHGDNTGYPMPMGLPADQEGEVSVWVRYFYQGGKLTRDGKLLRLRLSPEELLEGRNEFMGEKVLDVLKHEGVDLDIFQPYAYQGPRGVIKGWVPLTSDSVLDLSKDGPKRVDVQLFRPPVADQLVKPQDDGFFTIGKSHAHKNTQTSVAPTHPRTRKHRYHRRGFHHR